MSRGDTLQTDSDELTQILKDINKKAQQEVLGHEISFEDNVEEEIELPAAFSMDKFLKKVQEAQSTDIFSDVGFELAKRGIYVNYQIKFEGRIVAREKHPFSWEKVQRKYVPIHGEGSYQVISQFPDSIKEEYRLKKTYIKTQTEELGLLDPGEETEEEEKTPTTPPNGGTDMFTMLAYFDKQRAAESLKNEDRMANLMAENKEGQKILMATMMTAMQPKQNTEMWKAMAMMAPTLIPLLGGKKDNGSEIQMKIFETMTTLQKESQKTNMDMMDKLRESGEKNADRSRAEMKDFITSLGNKDDDSLTWPMVIEMTNKAKTDGYDLRAELDKMATDRAKELGGGDKEKSSYFEKVFEAVAPLLGAAYAQHKMNPAGTVPSAQLPGMGLPVPAARPTPKRPPVRAAGHVRPEAGPSTRQAPPKPQRSPIIRPTMDAYHSALDDIDLEEETDIEIEALETEIEEIPGAVIMEQSVDDVELVEKQDLGPVDEVNKEKIFNIALPIIAASYQENKPANVTADACIMNFIQLGIDPKTVERDFGIENIELLIDQLDLPEDMAIKLREFHGILIEKTRGTII